MISVVDLATKSNNMSKSSSGRLELEEKAAVGELKSFISIVVMIMIIIFMIKIMIIVIR